MSLNPLTINFILIAFCACSAADAKVIFDGAPDPSLEYPARQVRSSDETTDADSVSDSNQSSASNTPAKTTLSSFKVIHETDIALVSWHASIDKEIAKRFASISANCNFGASQVVLTFYVGKSKQIGKISFDKKSSNVMFNSVARAVINSLNNDSLLEFPGGCDGSDIQMRAEFNAPVRYENWHDERDRETRHIGDFKYIW